MRTSYVHTRRPPRIAGLGRARRTRDGSEPDIGAMLEADRAYEVDRAYRFGPGDETDQVYDTDQVQDGDGADDTGRTDGLAQELDQEADQQPDQGWGSDDGWDDAPAPEHLTEDDAVELLQRAHDRLWRSPSLRDVIDAVVDRLAGGCASDVALLRRDDEGGWHVVAGSGLRTLEVRPLAAMPPVLGRLDEDSPVLTIAQTDTIRGELAGLPLSRHRSLLVLRFPAELVTVLGRPDPFDQQDVELVTALLTAALPHLERGWRTEALLLSMVDWFEAETPTWG